MMDRAMGHVKQSNNILTQITDLHVLQFSEKLSNSPLNYTLIRSSSAIAFCI